MELFKEAAMPPLDMFFHPWGREGCGGWLNGLDVIEHSSTAISLHSPLPSSVAGTCGPHTGLLHQKLGGWAAIGFE